MQMELGQVQTSLGLVSQEAQVTHMQGLIVGQGAHPHVGTRMHIS